MKRSFLTFAGMFLTLCALRGAGENGEQLVFFSENSDDIIEKSEKIYGNPSAIVYCGDSVNYSQTVTFSLGSDLSILAMGVSYESTLQYNFGITGGGCYDNNDHHGQGNGFLKKTPCLELTWKEENSGWGWWGGQPTLVQGSLQRTVSLAPTAQKSCDGPVVIPPLD